MEPCGRFFRGDFILETTGYAARGGRSTRDGLTRFESPSSPESLPFPRRPTGGSRSARGAEADPDHDGHGDRQVVRRGPDHLEALEGGALGPNPMPRGSQHPRRSADCARVLDVRRCGWKIQGEAKKGREVYFALYQNLAEDEARPGLYREYPPDYFDLIVVDECHRGSARDESRWRELLTYFRTLGTTATPLRKENAHLRVSRKPDLHLQPGFGHRRWLLAPYRVHRVVPSVDATGYRPQPGELDRYAQSVPDLRNERLRDALTLEADPRRVCFAAARGSSRRRSRSSSKSFMPRELAEIRLCLSAFSHCAKLKFNISFIRARRPRPTGSL